MQITSNLSTLMGRMRYSIQDVHERTGLSRSTISNLYNDKVTRIDFDTLGKLCELFGCNTSDLLLTVDSTENIYRDRNIKTENILD